MNKQNTKKTLRIVSTISFFSMLLFIFGCQKQPILSGPWKLKPLPPSPANIIYTDINPDTTVQSLKSNHTGGAYYLDLNNDGTPDFVIQTYFVAVQPQRGSALLYFNYTSVVCMGTNSVGDTSSFANTIVNPVDTNQNINNYNLTWNSSNTAKNLTGEWDSASGVNKYLALKMNVGSFVYFGWVRMSILSSATGVAITIKDYAYNSLPGMAIFAGATK